MEPSLRRWRGLIVVLLAILVVGVSSTTAPPLLRSALQSDNFTFHYDDDDDDDDDKNSYSLITSPCVCMGDESNSNDSNENNKEVITASVLALEGAYNLVEWNARDYEKFTNGKVQIEVKIALTEKELHDEIIADARQYGGLFDAYLTSPIILGTAAMLNGFLDLTSYKHSKEAEWMDILLEIRNFLTSFDNKVYLIPLDGDTLTLYYRKDILNALNLTVPRTWNEYNDVAKAVHNITFDGKTISGSCISRMYGAQSHYFAHLILSTITQSNGTFTGSLFDSSTMAPLTTGEAVVEMLRLQEEQSKYGTSNEFEEGVHTVNNVAMNEGGCALTIFWGNLFRNSHSEGSALLLPEKLGIARTPGSEFVLNRANGKLERCTIDNCPYAKYIEDIGFVNYAPYAANGGWGGAVSNNTSDEKKKILVDFFLWAASGEQSEKYVIPNATTPFEGIDGQDPWRKSHLDLEKWVAKGFDRGLSKQFVDTVYSNFVSKNIVNEINFPHASQIMDILDKEVNTYLAKAHRGLITDNTSYDERMDVARTITDKWNNIITLYDKRLDTVAPILEIYQRSRGVFNPNNDKNQLNNIRIIGYILMSIILVSSTGALIWVVINRKLAVVMASQPPFLILICVGTFIMGTAILPLGIDESIASVKGCSIACMSVFWLIAIGFSVCFAALFSKIWRLNKIVKSSRSFRRITIKANDVMMPFIVLLALNFIFLIVWTVKDPLVWKRIDLGRDSEGTFLSVGLCAASGKTSAVMFGLIVTINIVAVAFASVQAYQTRHLSVAYHESKFVGLSLASILQSLLIGIPLLFITNQNSVAKYSIRTILVFAICMSVLCFIFLPKMNRGKNTTGHTNRSSSFMSGSRRGKSNITSSNMTQSTDGNIKSSRYIKVRSNGNNTAVNEEIERLKEEVKRLQIIVAQP